MEQARKNLKISRTIDTNTTKDAPKQITVRKFNNKQNGNGYNMNRQLTGVMSCDAKSESGQFSTGMTNYQCNSLIRHSSSCEHKRDVENKEKTTQVRIFFKRSKTRLLAF